MKTLQICVMMFLITITIALSAQEQQTDSHPILAETKWTYNRLRTHELLDPDGSRILWDSVTVYKSPMYPWTKEEHTIFGERVAVVYKVYNNAEDILLRLWISVEKDGTWYTSEFESFNWREIRDYSGEITAVILILNNVNGAKNIRRKVERNY